MARWLFLALGGGVVGLGQRYAGHMKNCGILVSVDCDDSEWESRAKKVLENAGATDISSAGEASAEYMTTGKPMPLSIVP